MGKGGSKLNPGKGKAYVRGPAKGFVYKPPSGIPAGGLGWGGGPAKGAGVGGPARQRSGQDLEEARRKLREDPVMAEKRKRLAATKEAQIAQLVQVWGDVMLNSEHDMAKVSAAEKLRDHLLGRPTQRNENVNVNLDPTDRDAEIERLLAKREGAGKRVSH